MFTKEKEEEKDLTFMGQLTEGIESTIEVGNLAEGPVINIDRAAIYIDLHPFGTGIIYGREFMIARDIIKKINIGDSITAKIVEKEGLDGYIELSLKEARQAMIWGEADAALQNKTILEITVKEANKGGLILDWQGVQGFLPASQLKPENYPKVEDGDKDKILQELKKFVGQKIPVSIIVADPKEGKLIFSEKGINDVEKKEIVGKYEVGNEVEGEVTGIVDFGIFVKIEEGLESLVHISEIDWALVEDPKTLFKIGDKIKAKVIEVKGGKISLSIKALKDNPWSQAGKKYEKGQKVEGVIIKFNKYGALASVEEGVSGLVHISEFGSEEELKEKLELGKTYPFTITFFDPENQKLTLAFGDKLKKEKVEEKKEEEKVEDPTK